MSAECCVAEWPVERLHELLVDHEAVVCVTALAAGSRGSSLASEILAAATGVGASELNVQRTSNGKPYLHMDAPPLHFSVSHSGSVLAVAMSRTREVGVDIERERAVPEWERVAERVFDGATFASLEADIAGGMECARAFTRHWCRNEARVKATGAGLFGRDGRADAGAPRVMDLPALPLPAGGARFHAALAIR